MKANRKFLHGDDDAVSPVIAVILMVAITVVLAATVYVWVSGFGANGSAPAKSMAFASAGAITSDCSNDGATTANDFCKSYSVASASPGLKYADIKLNLEGAELTFDSGGCGTVLGATTEWGACAGATPRTGTSLVTAGDTVKIAFSGAAGLSGKSLQIVDPNSNSIIVTLTVS